MTTQDLLREIVEFHSKEWTYQRLQKYLSETFNVSEDSIEKTLDAIVDGVKNNYKIEDDLLN